MSLLGSRLPSLKDKLAQQERDLKAELLDSELAVVKKAKVRVKKSEDSN